MLPVAAKSGDAGYDLVAIDDGVISPEGFIEYRTGLAIEPPEGCHLEIFPRSSVSKYDLALANGIGLVDESFRGELKLRFRPVGAFYDKSQLGAFNRLTGCANIYKKGDRIGQIVIRITINDEFKWADELNETSRGAGGFGSSGV